MLFRVSQRKKLFCIGYHPTDLVLLIYRMRTTVQGVPCARLLLFGILAAIKKHAAQNPGARTELNSTIRSYILFEDKQKYGTE